MGECNGQITIDNDLEWDNCYAQNAREPNMKHCMRANIFLISRHYQQRRHHGITASRHRGARVFALRHWSNATLQQWILTNRNKSLGRKHHVAEDRVMKLLFQIRDTANHIEHGGCAWNHRSGSLTSICVHGTLPRRPETSNRQGVDAVSQEMSVCPTRPQCHRAHEPQHSKQSIKILLNDTAAETRRK